MKATLEFNLPEEQEEHELALNGHKYKIAVEEIWNQVFRPYYKHGYDDSELNDLLHTDSGAIIVEKLAEIYRKVINDET